MSSIDAISKLNKISKTPTMSIIDSYLNNESALENLNISDSNDSQHEISKLKQIYQNKLKEIDSLYKEILLKDEKISQLNQKGIYSSKGNESKRNSQINLINVIRKLDDNTIKVKLLILIYDETYKQKKEYYMVWSNEQLVDKLGYDRRTIYKALSELVINITPKLFTCKDKSRRNV